MIAKVGVAMLALGVLAYISAESGISDPGRARIAKEIGHEIVTLPDYGVFDNVHYRVGSNGTVTLQGQVAKPALKAVAEREIGAIDGVAQVTNELAVLPNSPEDEQLRMALYRSIYNSPQLDKYAVQAVPPIHIVVENGNATLEGTAANESDKILAGMEANSVPGVASVTNNLHVEVN